MTYKRQPEVTYQCQVFIDLKGKRCSHNATHTLGKTNMCEQHWNKHLDTQEQERLRLKDKYAGETT
jgi:hypothetical protein